MSHEIRTTLSGLLGMKELLSCCRLKPEQCEEVESISESGQPVFGVMDDVLDFSKIKTGKRLVEAMGGQIGYRNNPEREAVFWFKLPVMGGKPPVVENEPEHAARGDFHGRVMLAEDNLINRKVATKMLEILGLEVDGAADGKEALALAKERAYPIIFLDCRMPNMDGYEAARRIREIAREGRPPAIIALTANASADDRERCFAAGMDDYLTKPIDLETLRKTVSKWLQKEGGDGQPV